MFLSLKRERNKMFSAYKEGGLPIEFEKRGTSMVYVAKKFQFPSGKIIRKK